MSALAGEWPPFGRSGVVSVRDMEQLHIHPRRANTNAYVTWHHLYVMVTQLDVHARVHPRSAQFMLTSAHVRAHLQQTLHPSLIKSVVRLSPSAFTFSLIATSVLSPTFPTATLFFLAAYSWDDLSITLACCYLELTVLPSATKQR